MMPRFILFNGLAVYLLPNNTWYLLLELLEFSAIKWIHDWRWITLTWKIKRLCFILYSLNPTIKWESEILYAIFYDIYNEKKIQMNKSSCKRSEKKSTLNANKSSQIGLHKKRNIFIKIQNKEFLSWKKSHRFITSNGSFEMSL